MADSDVQKYAELIELIQGADAGPHESESMMIDLDMARGQANGGKASSYSELLEFIEAAEGSGRQKRGEELQRQKEQKPLQEHIVMAGLEQAKYSNPIPHGSFAAMEEEKAKEELKELKEKFGGIAPKLKELKRPRAKSSDLVLPTLSLTDQISELERIIEGVKSNIFDKEHMEIVKLEVFGLDSIVEKAARERKKQAKQQAEKSELEESLVSVRNQRLADAVALLQNR
ncbi:MAG: hypothetical protein QXK65_02905 [Candidatus Micrarchaeaceae archaeon]